MQAHAGFHAKLVEVQLFISPPDLAFDYQRIRKLEVLFFSQLFFWPQPQEGKAARGALKSCCPSSEQGVGAAGCKEWLQSVIQVGQHSRHQTHNEWGVNCITSSSCQEHINLLLPQTWLLDFATHTSVWVLFYFFWLLFSEKLKESFCLPGEREPVIFDKIQLSKNWKDFMRMKNPHCKVTFVASGHLLCQISKSCSYCHWFENISWGEKRVKEFFIIIESICQPKYRDSYQFLYNTLQRHLN